MASPPAYRILTPRLCLRCWEPSDAPRLVESITASLEHLRPSMLWAADEPQSVDEKTELLRRFRGMFDLGQDFIYGVFDRDERTVIGGSGLHPRVFEGGREIGYWIDARQTRRGYATEVTAALTKVGFEVEKLLRVEVHVDTRNAASAAIPPKLGFRHEATLPGRVKTPAGLGDRMIFGLHASEYSGSPAAALKVEAFDARGERLL